VTLTTVQTTRVRRFLLGEWDTAEDPRALLGAVTDAEELHRMALQFNWDCGCAELRLIVEHPMCDEGTALLVFWPGQPGWHRERRPSELPPSEREVWLLQQLIEQRYAAGAYSRARFRVDPHNICGHDLLKEYRPDRCICPIPPALLHASPGLEAAPLAVDY
jgi:hypothetical protein